MKLVQSILALALVGSVSSAFAVTPGYLGNLSGQTVIIGNSFATGTIVNDIYTFDIAPVSSTAGTAVTLNLDIPLFPGVEFALNSFGIAIYDSANTLIVSDIQANALDTQVQVSTLLGAAMGYQFVVSGNAAGSLGGNYAGVLLATPVPEAETYGMMLAGLGLIGFMVSRRRGSL